MTCRLPHLLAVVLCPLALVGGCGPKAKLHSTFGDTYRAHFAAQVAEHNHRPVAGFTGDEARRAIHAYHNVLLPENGQNSSPGGSGGSGITLPSMPSGSGAQGNPFSFKVR